MSHLFFRNIFRVTHQLVRSAIPRNSNLHTFGIIPGGGLSKLQGIKEEDYFWRQEHKLFENLKNVQKTQFVCTEYQPNKDKATNPPECAFSLKHKNLTEEAYFLNDHCDCLKLLQTKIENQQKGD